MHALLRAANPEAGHHWPMPPPETVGYWQASLGQSLAGSWLVSSGSWCTQDFVCALQESLFPVLCKFWWLYGGGELIANSSKRAYAIPRSTAPRAPAPAAVRCWSVPPQETNTVLSQSLGSQQETDPDLPMCVQESPAETWVSGGLLQGWKTWVQQCLHGTFGRGSSLS